MKIPVIRGIIERRILVNYRVDPKILAAVMPRPFRPKVVNGSGIVGVCLIRLKQIRTRFMPSFLGISSENAAHRFAVEWEERGQKKEGVFIPRRDTSSRINTIAGGKLFPGEHHHARFKVNEADGQYQVVIDSDDRVTHLLVKGYVTSELPKGSVFGSLKEASNFFERGSLGYSAKEQPGQYEGLELRSYGWKVQPLAVDTVESSFFGDRARFPSGSLEFDCALLMRGIEHEWLGREPLYVEPALPIEAQTGKPPICEQ
jgi:hypothetical protein